MMWQNMGFAGLAGNTKDVHHFHPVLKAASVDPNGAYVRKWCPELSKLPDNYLFCPWEADPRYLEAKGVVLGVNYPRPVIHDVWAARDLTCLRILECRSRHPEWCDRKTGLDLMWGCNEPERMH